MESHQVLKEIIDRIGAKELANRMGVSLSLVYKWTQPPADAEKGEEKGSGSRNPLDRVVRIMELSDEEEVIRWLSQHAGGYFVKNPENEERAGNNSEEALGTLPATTEIVSEFSDMLGTVARSAHDEHITDEEAQEIRQLWEKLKGYTEAYVSSCEKGKFNK